MIVEIRKEMIPDWDYGDVAIKTYSFGDQNKIADMSAKIKGSISAPDITIKDDISLDKLNNHALMAGIHYIKTKDNILFIIKPNTMTDDKLRYGYSEISKDAGNFLLKKVTELNTPISDDEKKNLIS